MRQTKAQQGAGGEGESHDERLFLKSVEKTFRVLEVFGQSPHPLTLSDIAAAAGIDKSNAQRLCHTLLALRYLLSFLGAIERFGNQHASDA